MTPKCQPPRHVFTDKPRTYPHTVACVCKARERTVELIAPDRVRITLRLR